MATETVMAQVPENLYRRLEKTAHAMRRSIEDVMLHTLRVGSPPAWDDAPPEFQADLAAPTVWMMPRYGSMLLLFFASFVNALRLRV
jgi:hypothetical protein